MIRHIFLDKTVTIIKSNKANTGLNPVLELCYGDNITRGLIHFNYNEIGDLINDKTFADQDKLSYTIKMINCLGIAGVPYEKSLLFGNTSTKMEHTPSFTLLALKLPYDFDAGRGFEFSDDTWIKDKKSYSTFGSNWYNATNEQKWDSEGVYTTDKIQEEYEKFLSGESSLVVGSQHFDFGDENINIDITDYVKSITSESENHGLLLCFTPELEKAKTETQQCANFFALYTNTFFHPYIECQYDEYIDDNRDNFCLNHDNKLYFYAFLDGIPVNLDNLPTCSVEGSEFTVKQATKGVYYAIVNIDGEPESILYDTWSNLKYLGTELDDIEMEFVAHSLSNRLKIGEMTPTKDNLVPSIYGINDDERLSQSEIREVIIDFRKKYTTDKKELTNKAFYRLYSKDTNKEIDVFEYQPIEKQFLNNYFIINTSDLVVGNYFVDIKVIDGRDERYFKDVLHFKVVDNVTERYR